ncbi:MAG: PTS sugar transporter subunit IIA, partial [Candidatus Omnitrophica bacterium]|nr:PTS sugar transporter subunit IIA [Candidatus Omnitrophota bacterium]
PVTARALHDLKLSKTDLGFLIMSALSVNDIIGWLIFTVILGFFTQSALHIANAAFIVAATIGFTVLCLTLGRTFSNLVISKMNERQMPQPGTSLTFICLLGLLCGAVTQKIGVHALFGFFIAGIMAGEAKALSERTRQIISQMVYAIFVPLFFASIGLKIDFLSHFDLFLVILISVIGIAGRFIGAWLGVYLTEQSRENQLSIAIAHTPGGAMEIVVGILALEYKLITETVFIAIVVSAIFSCLTLGPWLSHSIRRRKKVGMLEYISTRFIIPDLKTDSRNKAIYKLCEIVAEQEEIPDAEMLYSAILKREDEMGTAIEEGIALPHLRSPLIKRPVVAVGRAPSGIEWNSPDGKPTRIIFLIMTPQNDEGAQIQILAYIARAMADPHVRSGIIKAHDAQEIFRLLRDIFNSQHVAKGGGNSL